MEEIARELERDRRRGASRRRPTPRRTASVHRWRLPVALVATAVYLGFEIAFATELGTALSDPAAGDVLERLDPRGRAMAATALVLALATPLWGLAERMRWRAGTVAVVVGILAVLHPITVWAQKEWVTSGAAATTPLEREVAAELWVWRPTVLAAMNLERGPHPVVDGLRAAEAMRTTLLERVERVERPEPGVVAEGLALRAAVEAVPDATVAWERTVARPKARLERLHRAYREAAERANGGYVDVRSRLDAGWEAGREWIARFCAGERYWPMHVNQPMYSATRGVPLPPRWDGCSRRTYERHGADWVAADLRRKWPREWRRVLSHAGLPGAGRVPPMGLDLDGFARDPAVRALMPEDVRRIPLRWFDRATFEREGADAVRDEAFRGALERIGRVDPTGPVGVDAHAAVMGSWKGMWLSVAGMVYHSLKVALLATAFATGLARRDPRRRPATPWWRRPEGHGAPV